MNKLKETANGDLFLNGKKIPLIDRVRGIANCPLCIRLKGEYNVMNWTKTVKENPGWITCEKCGFTDEYELNNMWPIIKRRVESYFKKL